MQREKSQAFPAKKISVVEETLMYLLPVENYTHGGSEM
jgi:hypothetical protein